MSKSMLVIDTPESCELCNFCGYAGEKDRVCLASPSNQILEDGYYTKIPEWCPLDSCEIAAKGLTEMVREWDRGML